jgi:phosphate transport system protein
MATGHTVKAFDEDLDQIRAMICEMGGLAEAAIRESVYALTFRDHEGAAAIGARRAITETTAFSTSASI